MLGTLGLIHDNLKQTWSEKGLEPMKTRGSPDSLSSGGAEELRANI